MTFEVEAFDVAGDRLVRFTKHEDVADAIDAYFALLAEYRIPADAALARQLLHAMLRGEDHFSTSEGYTALTIRRVSDVGHRHLRGI